MVPRIWNGWRISHNDLNSVSYSHERRLSLELFETYKTDKSHTSRFLLQFYSVRKEANFTLQWPSYHALRKVLYSHSLHTRILTFFSDTNSHTEICTLLVWCNATGRGLVGHQVATTWVKVLGLCFQMTTEAGLLEAAATIVFTVQSSWSTGEMIAQASDDIIKVVPKMKTRSSDLCPWADWR